MHFFFHPIFEDMGRNSLNKFVGFLGDLKAKKFSFDNYFVKKNLQINLPICRIKGLSFIKTIDCLIQVTHMLEYLSLEHKEFNKSWGVVDGLINSLQGFLEVFVVVMMLRQKIQQP